MFSSMKWVRTAFALILAAVLLSGGIAVAKKPVPPDPDPDPEPTVSYALTWLDSLTVAGGMNDTGDVVGYFGGDAIVNYVGANGRVARNLNDFVSDPNWHLFDANDINNRNDDSQVQIVGNARYGSHYYYRAYRLTLDLSSPDGPVCVDFCGLNSDDAPPSGDDNGTGSLAEGINDYGDVVGTRMGLIVPYQACIWSDLFDSGWCTVPLFGEANSNEGFAINNSMQATGNSYLEQRYLYLAWRYSPPAENAEDLEGIKARPGIGIESQGRSINDSGDVVGWSTAGKEYHGFLYTDETGIVDLGTLPGGTFSDATDINLDGIVTGVARAADGSVHCFVYDSRGADPEMLRIDVDEPLLVRQSDQPRINSSGCIVCSPSTTEGVQACLLIPVLP